MSANIPSGIVEIHIQVLKESLIPLHELVLKTEGFIVFLEVGYLCEGCSAMAADLCLQTSHGCAGLPGFGCLLLL